MRRVERKKKQRLELLATINRKILAVLAKRKKAHRAVPTPSALISEISRDFEREDVTGELLGMLRNAQLCVNKKRKVLLYRTAGQRDRKGLTW